MIKSVVATYQDETLKNLKLKENSKLFKKIEKIEKL